MKSSSAMNQTRHKESKKKKHKYKKPPFCLHMDKQTANFEKLYNTKWKLNMKATVLASSTTYDHMLPNCKQASILMLPNCKQATIFSNA